MALLSRELITRDLEGSFEDAENVVWRCGRIADELYPADADYERADIAEKKLFVDCYAVSQGDLVIPESISVDQLEDWLASRAVKAVCELELTRSDVNISVLQSEFTLHGFRTVTQSMHRWGY